jgi:hypothetical protein
LKAFTARELHRYENGESLVVLMNGNRESYMALPIFSSIIAVLGLIVAALALILNYKSRANALRETLYRKQLDIYPSIMEKLLHFHDLAMTFIHDPLTKAHPEQEGIQLTESRKQALRSNQEVMLLLQDVQNTMRCQSLLMPSSVSDAMEGYVRVFLAVSAPEALARFYPPELTAATDPAEPLAEAFIQVFTAIRSGLGVERLHESTLKLIGGQADELAELRLSRPHSQATGRD